MGRKKGNGISKGIDRSRIKAGFSEFYVSVDGKKMYYPNEAMRDQAYADVLSRRTLGLNSSTAHDTGSILMLDEMRRMAAGRQESLIEIFRHGLANLPSTTMTVQAAVDDFIADKERAVENRMLKRNSFCQQRRIAREFAGQFGSRTLISITQEDVKKWIFQDKNLQPKSQQSFGRGLSVFLCWCVEKKKCLSKSPMDGIALPDPPPQRTVFSLKEVERVFAVAMKRYPELLTLLAVEFFAGIRPETAEKLTFSAFHRDDDTIVLREGKFEQGGTEFVDGPPPVFWEWIQKKGTGRISPPKYKHVIAAFHKALGFDADENPWPRDVARHTFCSNFARYTGSLEKLANVMNHKRPATTLKYYRNLLPKQDAVFYCTKLVPAHIKKVAARKTA